MSAIAGDVGDELPDVDHDVAVEEAGGQLGVTDMRGTGVLVGGAEVVDHREVVHLGLLGMNGERVCNVYRGVDVGAGVGRDHAAEERALDPARQARLIAERLPVGALLREEFLRRLPCRVGVVPVLGDDSPRAFQKVLNLGLTEEQRLAALLVAALAAIDALVEHRAHRHGDLLCHAVLAHRRHHPAIDDVARAHRSFHARNGVNGVGVVGDPPVALEALRRDARANHATVGDTLGQPRVVAVE